MSRGAYTVIGDVVHIELPSKSTFTDDGTPTGTPLKGLALMKATNKYALEYLDNNIQIDLSDYDNFDYVSNNHHDQVSDNILDMVYMVYRTPGLQHFARKDTPGFEYDSFGGIAQLGKSYSGQEALPSGLVIDYGPFSNGSGLTMHLGENRKKRFDDSYIHELAHYLMGGNHPYTNGGYTSSVGRSGYWGIFGGNQATNSVNAYEQELLGWITPTELTSTISFTLSDFVSTGSSYKYTISPTEFYYFENRQKIQVTTGIDNTYDQPNWNGNDKGLFVLHVKENIYGNYLYSSDNSLESVVSNGNWDWEIDTANSWQSGVCHVNGEPAFYKGKPNRFGESFKDPIMEVDNPNDTLGSYKQSLFVKASNPTQCKNYFLGYDSEDKSGFTEIERSLITPYTNPAFLTRSKSQIGIGLKITGKFVNTLALKFYDDAFDPYTITENTTWDGQIFLDETTNIENNSVLTILPGTTVLLDDNVSLVIRPGAKLISEGTQTEPIRFIRGDADNDWNRISLFSSAGNSIKWTLFDGGYINLSIASKNNTIEHSTFRNASFRTMQGWHNQDGSGNASATISYSLIENSATVGLVSQYLNLDLSYTTIRNNVQTGLYVLSNSVKPFHHNKITGNGGTTRDGIEVLSSGTLYMYGQGYGAGYNEIQTNGDDQISSSGDLFIGEMDYNGVIGGYNSIYGNYSGSRYLVDNNSGSTVQAEYVWWGQYPADPDMTDGPVQLDQNMLPSDPTIGQNPGAGGQVPAKIRAQRPTVQDMISAYDKAEQALGQAETTQQAIDEVYALYQLAGISGNIELKNRFNSLIQDVAQANRMMYASTNRNKRIQDYAKVLYTKSLIRDERYGQAQEWLRQGDFSRLAGKDQRNYLHLRMVTEAYHGSYETALSTLDELYSLHQAKGENLEEVQSRYAPIREDIVARLEGDEETTLKEKQDTEGKKETIDEFSLQNYPNPFNPVTVISFSIAEKSFVTLTVYDLLGREVNTLVNQNKESGSYSVRFDASSLSSGVYIYRLETNQKVLTKRMTVIK